MSPSTSVQLKPDFLLLWEATWGKALCIEKLSVGKHVFDVLILDNSIRHILATNLQFIGVPQKILLRPEYYQTYRTVQSDNRAIYSKYVVTGQSGIGKTVFTVFVLMKRLSEQLPVAVQPTSDGYILFDEKGARYQHYRLTLDMEELPATSWALVDSHTGNHQPCGRLLGEMDAVLLNTTSPVQNRWKQWKKETDAEVYIMDVWSIPELTALLVLLGRDVEHGLAIAMKYGPCARLVVKMTSERAENFIWDHERDLNLAAKALVKQTIIFPRGSDFGWKTEEDYASALLFLRPEGHSRKKRYYPSFYIPTENIAKVIAKHLLAESIENKIKLFDTLTLHPTTTSSIRWIFENFVHTYFPIGRIVLIDADGTDRIPVATDISLRTLIGTVDGLTKHDPPFYWRPTQSDLPGVDAVFVSSDCVLVIQAALSLSRSKAPDAGIARVIESLGYKKCQNLKFVFVGPDWDTVSYLCRAKKTVTVAGMSVPVYGCVLPMGSSNRYRPGLDTLRSKLEEAMQHASFESVVVS